MTVAARPLSGNLAGAALMAGGMLAATMADALLKVIGNRLAPEQTLWIAGLMGMALCGVLVVREGEQVLARRLLRPAFVMRSLSEVIITGSIMVALTMTSFALFSAILQSVPILVTFGAVVLFGEHVGPRRWVAILIGFAGVMVMVRPDGDGAALGALFSLSAAAGMALRDLTSRRLPPEITTMQATFWGYPGLFGLGFALSVTRGGPVLPGWQTAGLIALFTLAMASAIFLITAAMRRGEVAVVAPMRYSRLIFAFLVAWAVFGEHPDTATWAGAAIVVASGLFILRREAAQNLPVSPADSPRPRA